MLCLTRKVIFPGYRWGNGLHTGTDGPKLSRRACCIDLNKALDVTNHKNLVHELERLFQGQN